MSDQLQGLLLNYIRDNNPELLQQLDEDDALHAWVLEKIGEVEMVLGAAKAIRLPQTAYMDLMTVDLKPSKFHYVRDLLEDQFPDEFDRMIEQGVLRFEVIQIIGACGSLFEEIPLRDNLDENVQLDYEVKKVIRHYLAGVYE